MNIAYGACGVEFDEILLDIRGGAIGHDLKGRCRDGHGWNVPDDLLVRCEERISDGDVDAAWADWQDQLSEPADSLTRDSFIAGFMAGRRR